MRNKLIGIRIFFLAESRNLTDWEKQHYGFVLSWFESWRLRKRLEACRETAVEFWRTQVTVQERKQWQVEGWAEGISWYLNWLRICKSEGREVCSVPERMHRAVMNLA